MNQRVEHLAEGVTLHLGDCREILPTLAGIDLVFTSPPYNLGQTAIWSDVRKLGHYPSTTRDGNIRGGCGKWSGGVLKGYASHDDAMSHTDYVAWQREILGLCWRALSTAGAIYYNHKCRVIDGQCLTPLEYNPGLPLRQIITWSRGSGFNCTPVAYMPTSEWIVVLARPEFRLRSRSASGVGDVWSIPADAGNEHPAPFPVKLAATAIETTPAELVCDPFMGSGTTGVAAAQLGRKFIGIEKEQIYFDMACRRIADVLAAPKMFSEPGTPGRKQQNLFSNAN